MADAVSVVKKLDLINLFDKIKHFVLLPTDAILYSL